MKPSYYFDKTIAGRLDLALGMNPLGIVISLKKWSL
jgi:hypothetical protein